MTTNPAIVDAVNRLFTQVQTLITKRLGQAGIHQSSINAAHLRGTPPSTIMSSISSALSLAVFGASGASHSQGLVPDPGAAAGTTRFLREDSSWNVPAGGGSPASPRQLFVDDCSSSALPTGASSSGQLTYDSTNVRRLLGGTSASEYDIPAQTLNGPLAIEVIHENNAAIINGDFFLSVFNGATEILRLAYQGDNNVVLYDGAGATSWGSVNAAGTRDLIHFMWRGSITVSPSKVVHMSASMPTGDWVGSTGADGPKNGAYSNEAVSFRAPSGQTFGAGTSLTFKLRTTSTRQVALYGVRVYSGVKPV